MMNNKVIYLNEEQPESFSEKEQFETDENKELSNSYYDDEHHNMNVKKNKNKLNKIVGGDNFISENGDDDSVGGASDSADDSGDIIDEPSESVDAPDESVDGGADIDNKKVISEYDEQYGGAGNEHDMDDVSSNLSGAGSSVCTDEILEHDPMYIRLTKFLQTSGKDNKNISDILLDISNNFEKLNKNLEDLTNKMTKTLQQK